MSELPSLARVEELYHAALGRPARERDAFLDEACGDDERLRHEVKSLLDCAEEAQGLLERPLADAVTRELAVCRGARLGPYEILDLIATGGMGEVYRARDTRLGREAAIKILDKALSGDADQLARFEREARSAAALNHPNIATVYETGEHEGTRFIAMELVEGRTLKDRLEAGPLPVKAVLDLATQIARGLAAAHGAGIVHRDLKPANLMVTSDGLVKILDFGLAKQAGDASDVRAGITGDGSVLGTALYMSPEQAAGRPVDHRSDQFSFGTILYEMATGRRPFERRTTPQTLAAVIQDEPVPVRELAPGISVEVAALVARCLAKDPSQRYDSTARLVEELASAAAAPAPVRHTARWWATGAALLVLAAFVSSDLSRPPASQRGEVLPEAVPLTTYPGREKAPAFSPDASQVAFSWDGAAEDNDDIYVKTIGSEEPLRLTSDPARDGSPAWSPDGSEIAFLREKGDGSSELRLVPPTGGPERLLAEVQALADLGLSWSPDGRSLAVVDRSSPADRPGIFLLDVASGAKQRLSSPPPGALDVLPAFSPDGRAVAFNRTRLGHLFVCVVDAAGGTERELAEASHPRGRLAWGARGHEVLFAATLGADDVKPRPSRGDGNGASLWAVPALGGKPRPLRSAVGAVDVAVSRDGRRVVYSQETTDWDIWQLELRPRAAATAAQTRLIASTAIDANPRFSPDGERVAFASTRSGQPEIWVADQRGGHPLRLTSLGGYAGAPRWSPDGQTIAFDFAKKDDKNVDIYAIGSTGGLPRRLTSSPAIDAMPSWSSDGRWIYFASLRDGTQQVWKVPSVGEEQGSARQITRGGGFAAIESSDGRYVYFSRRQSGTSDPRNAIWRIPAAGGDEEVVIESFRSSSGSWDLTAEGVYFLDQEASVAGMPWVVRFLRFGARHATDVAQLRYLPFLAGPAVSVSPDGRRLLSTQSQGRSDLMLVESARARPE